MKVIIIGINLVSVKCPGCGASLELTPASEQGRCDYCGTSFIVPAPGEDTGLSAKSGKIKKYNSDWVLRLTDLTVKRFLEEHEIDLSKDSEAMKRITEASRKVAIELEEDEESTMNIPFVVQDLSHPLHICENYTRSDMIKTD